MLHSDKVKWNEINDELIANINWSDISKDNYINTNTTMFYERLRNIIEALMSVCKKKKIV